MGNIGKRIYIAIIAILISSFIVSALAVDRVSAAGKVVYVTENGAGGKNGTSWSNALPGNGLQNAIDTAPAGTQIWIAAGTYRPTKEVDGMGERDRAFQMKNDVAIYGGFAGNEHSIEQRDFTKNKTILSGDLGGGVHTYHVLHHPDDLYLKSSALLDGVTITGGQADGSGIHDFGGGILDIGGSPTFTNITVSENIAIGGGGIAILYGSPTLTNMIVSGNAARGESSMGGGIVIYQGAPSLTNLVVSGNVVSGGNLIGGGGGIAVTGGNPRLNNVTISGNYISGNNMFGSGMLNASPGSPTVRNSIIYGNGGSSTIPVQEVSSLGGNLTFSYSLIGGSGGSGTTWDSSFGTDGGGNLDADPLFKNHVLANNEPTTGGDYRVKPNSPAMNAGDPDYSGPTTDLAGRPRIAGGRVDMGAYEFQLHITLEPDRTTLSNEPVTITVKVEETDSTVSEIKWAKGNHDTADFADGNFGTSILTEKKFVVIENGVYTVYVRDDAGFEAVQTIEIDLIEALRLIILPIITAPSGVPFTTMIYDPNHLYAVGTIRNIDSNGITGEVTGTAVGSTDYVRLSGTLNGSASDEPVQIELADDLYLHVRIINPPQGEGTFELRF